MPQIPLSSIGITKHDLGNKAFTLLRKMMTSDSHISEKKLITPIIF